MKQNYTIEGVDGHKVSYNLKQLKSFCNKFTLLLDHPLFNKEASRDTNNSKFRMIKQGNLNRTDCLSDNLISIQSIAKPYEAKSIEEQVSNDDLARDQTPTCLKETFKSKRKKSSNFSTKKNKIRQFMRKRHINSI